MSNNKTGLFAQVFITVLASVSASAAFFLIVDKKIPDLFHRLSFEEDSEDANLAEANGDTAEVESR